MTPPSIDPDDLLGYTFVKEHHGTQQRAEVKEINKEDGKFLVEFVNGGEELMTYNDLINIYNSKMDDGDQYWTYERILDHCKAKGGQLEVKILWDTGDITYEHMDTIKADDKITLAAYARDKGLLDQPGWKWARRFTKNPKKFVRMSRIFTAQTKSSWSQV